MRLSNFINLLRNENMKIYKRVATWVMIGILLMSILGLGLIEKYINVGNNTQTNWRENITNQNKMYEENLEQPLPKGVKDYYQKQYDINNYRLAQDIPPVEADSLWGLMSSSQGIISLVTLFTIIIAAGTVASEFSWGTIKLLLIRPVSRSKILLSKYVSALLFALTMLIVLFVVTFLLGALLYGFEGVEQPHLAYVNGEIIEKNMPLHIITLYAYNSVNLIMLVTFAFMISTVFRSSSLSIGLSIFLMFTGQQLVMLLGKYEWAKYLLFANTNLIQYIDGSPIVKGMTMQFSLIMLAIYFLVFNLFSWFIFNKRDVAA